jgi:RimJ/RimL family protein N-acetyltransferase
VNTRLSLKIEGKIINLRTLKSSDAHSICKNANDKEISENTPLPYPYTLKHAHDFIRICQRHYKNKTDYELGIEFKRTGEIIGMISLMHIDNKNRNAEVGYWLGKRYWKKGIASEALTLILNFGFNNLKSVRIYAKVLHTNLPSIKLLQRTGFKYEGRMRKSVLKDGGWFDKLMFALLDVDYKEICRTSETHRL